MWGNQSGPTFRLASAWGKIERMSLSPRALLAWSRTSPGRKACRYSIVSVVSVAVSSAVLFLTLYVLALWSAVVCNVVATTVASVPSYYLNRRWAWGKSGKSHLLKEVIPFWALALIGLGLSTGAVALADRYGSDITSSHLGQAIVVVVAQVAGFGVVWVGKFIIFNRLLFVDRSSPALIMVGDAAGDANDGSAPLVNPSSDRPGWLGATERRDARPEAG